MLAPLLSLVVVVAPAEQLAQAQQAFDALEFDKVVVLVPQPRDWKRFTRPQVIQALSLRALSLASVKRDQEAATSFRQLLSVAPEFQLPEQFGPRVRTLMLEAKDVTEKDRLLITFEADAFVIAGTAAGLAQRVVIGWGNRLAEFPLAARLEAPWAKGTPVDAWAAVLGPGGSVLAEWGNEAAPRRVGVLEAPVEVAKRPTRPLSTLSLIGIITGAVGVAAVGGGLYALTLAARPEQSLAQATRDMQGRITSLSQRDAFALDAAANGAWQAAGGLLIAGGLAVAAGVTMFILGMSVGVGPSSVSLSVPFDADFGLVVGGAP